MALKNEKDITGFGRKILALMESKACNTPKELATKLYDSKLVRVKSRGKEPFKNRKNAIESIEKKICVHIHADKASCLQGEFVLAYCNFFGCSADYLFDFSDIKTSNVNIRHLCECTGLSEMVGKRLIEDLPEDIKKDLMQFWTEMLESNIFYGLPLEWHQMCFELGQYYTAQDQIKKINSAVKVMGNSDAFVETWRTMMEENYLKEAEPHAGAYYMHLNSIVSCMTQFLEQSAESYAVRRKKDVDEFFFKKMKEKSGDKHEIFLKNMAESE